VDIELLEISNFRKLLSVRIDFSRDTTLFVGANNSGKTSAMLAMRRFLSPRASPFEIHDFTLCHGPTLVEIGDGWLNQRDEEGSADLGVDQWVETLPTLDIWLQVNEGELHLVRDLIPTLDWSGGRIGLRLRFEPKSVEAIYKEFIDERRNVDAMLASVTGDTQLAGEVERTEPQLTVWPEDLKDFLSKRLQAHFAIRAYPLDPGKLAEPEASIARPQATPPGSRPIDRDPLSGLIRVHDIPAQRGFGEERRAEDDDKETTSGASGRLSEQLRRYYSRHLDPTKGPDPTDLEALQAIEAAQHAFDERLTASFEAAFEEVQGLGYPGVTDPRPKVSTRLKAVDGLNHSAAISFEVDVSKADEDEVEMPNPRLPEGNNGLGYQNLISMIFQLMSFRDAWMRVGKALKDHDDSDLEPLHLVLVEEPEAHLHAQVQQVFIKKAYDVLRDHADLRDSKQLRTQLVVSTHSSHVAHETLFSSLRYFRRLPAGMCAPVPVSAVVNLSEVFGPGDKTAKFVTRYLRAHHADLFFADAAILVEGTAEAVLVPNFIREHYPDLHQRYVTLLEIRGSHAHRLKPLIDHLKIPTLIVTDLDSLGACSGKAETPATGAGQRTSNTTIKKWIPALENVDQLLELDSEQKELRAQEDPLFAVRVAYQVPIQVPSEGEKDLETVCPYTFEDAIALENLEKFESLPGYGLVRKFREAIAGGGSVAEIAERMFTALEDGGKAEFALDLLGHEEFSEIRVPTYMREGLEWLSQELTRDGTDWSVARPSDSGEVESGLGNSE